MNFIKKNTKFLTYFFGVPLLLAAASATATVMNFIDKVDPNPDQLISFGNNKTYSFIHSIIVDQDGTDSFWSGIYGYNSLTDIISGASIALRFKDESNDTALESVQLIFDGQSFGTQTITSGGATFVASISSGWDTLLNDGILNITLQNAGTTSGPQNGRSDFYFLDSTLTVEIDRRIQPQQQVPEPAPFTLIFLGLAGLIFSRRKFF